MSDNLIFWGSLLAFCAFAITSITILACWFAGWPVILQSVKETLMAFSIPIVALFGSAVAFTIAGVKKLRRKS